MHHDTLEKLTHRDPQRRALALAARRGDHGARQGLADIEMEARSMEAVTSGFYKVGKNIMVKVGDTLVTGKIAEVTMEEIVLEKAAWIADMGRHSEALRSNTYQEVEPYPRNVLLNRLAVQMATELTSEPPTNVQ